MVFRDLLHTLSGASRGADAEPCPRQCVVEHLNWLLNAGRHTVKHLDGYGLPPFADYLYEPNAEMRLANDLRRVIETYEPRLQQINVQPESGKRGEFGDQMQAYFVVEATIAETSERTVFTETAAVGRDGNVDIV